MKTENPNQWIVICHISNNLNLLIVTFLCFPKMVLSNNINNRVSVSHDRSTYVCVADPIGVTVIIECVFKVHCIYKFDFWLFWLNVSLTFLVKFVVVLILMRNFHEFFFKYLWKSYVVNLRIRMLVSIEYFNFTKIFSKVT